MITLKDILIPIQPVKITGDAATEINGLTIDSRAVKDGFVFIAINGVHVDGHTYIDKAIEQGAAAVVCETLPKELSDDMVYVQVKDSAVAAGLMADAYYGSP